eukprot:CAMPEP_0197629536 /NCGR_PEP_ID=MMETSP1338-20131121/7340_1 /TAXON_ID=43686 ORGANISM="Pelagodinium beii, Strain RCC1491" /NCGR_SAMPLE_ID=MMETSP1338 /ASSEMBLY_ACC=CAM_ASM_000754 /LENGTH=395 /DNA_ID=CAMNT_0043200587 /DNA_START=97 /DNA_END=1284 /DNA_ORIENTATION=+
MGFTSVLCLASLASAVEIHPHQRHEAFLQFQKQYGRSYESGSAEYDRRLALFSMHFDKAKVHNAKPDRLWTAGTGPLADRTEDELAELRGWFGSAKVGGAAKTGNLRKSLMLAQTSVTLPENFNWTSLSTLSEAREQGGCGSCWAVAAATVLDAHAEIYKSKQRSFSTQELVDCVDNPQHCGGKGGCSGATVELAMDYAINHAMKTEQDVKYTARDGKCTFGGSLTQISLQPAGEDTLDVASVGLHSASSGSGSMMTHWERLPENKYEPLLSAVYEHGPTAISVDAGSWSSYMSGIFNSCTKDAVINHAVVLIGFGTEEKSGKKHKYWLVENSWGSDWGENGRIRLIRLDNEESHCGVDKQPEDGTGCDGGPAKVEVCGTCGILYDNVVPHFKKA